MHKWISRLAGIFVGLLMAQSTWAELPHGTLQFITPNATSSSTDPIQIWVRLTLDADSPAFSFSSYPLTGISASDLPSSGYHYDFATGTYSYANFARIDSVSISASISCCGTPISDNYTLEFASIFNPSVPGLVYQDHFDLSPGSSYDYLFAQLTPKAGGAAAGAYQIFTAQLTLDVRGVDADGNWLAAVDRPVIASTCSDGDYSSCAFTRTVVAVPEPSTYALLGLGLAVMVFASRRKSTPRVR